MTPETSIYEYAKQSLNISADKPAIWFHDKSMTYRELFEKIDNVADHLAQLGVKEGTVVTIHLPNCPQAVIAIYAVAKLGAICNMVHPQMPEESLKNNILFTESTLLISSDLELLNRHPHLTTVYVNVESYTANYPGTGELLVRVVDFDSLVFFSKKLVKVPVQNSLSGSCAIYMHSSGTTGVPKIVRISHRAVNIWVENLKEHFCGDPLNKQVCLSSAPLFHALGLIADMHRAICYGAQLIQMDRWNNQIAVDLIKRYHITFLTGVTSLYVDLMRNPEFSGSGIEQLQYCFVGGEQVPQELITSVDYRVGHRCMYSIYGMTELCSAVCALNQRYDREGASGYPLKGVHFAVLGSEGILHRRGKGELLVHSNSVAMGYLKDPVASEAMFYESGDRKWFRTGDYGEIDADGYVYFISRLKNMIIHKGYNIFPSEIAAVINSLSFVSEVCVLGKVDDVNSTEQIIAVLSVVPETDIQCAKEQVFRLCEHSLPRYAVPQKVYIFDSLPHSSTGKIDIAVLRDRL